MLTTSRVPFVRVELESRLPLRTEARVIRFALVVADQGSAGYGPALLIDAIADKRKYENACADAVREAFTPDVAQLVRPLQAKREALVPHQPGPRPPLPALRPVGIDPCRRFATRSYEEVELRPVRSTA